LLHPCFFPCEPELSSPRESLPHLLMRPPPPRSFPGRLAVPCPVALAVQPYPAMRPPRTPYVPQAAAFLTTLPRPLSPKTSTHPTRPLDLLPSTVWMTPWTQRSWRGDFHALPPPLFSAAHSRWMVFGLLNMLHQSVWLNTGFQDSSCTYDQYYFHRSKLFHAYGFMNLVWRSWRYMLSDLKLFLVYLFIISCLNMWQIGLYSGSKYFPFRK
jgi:hypothetical protein